MPVSNSNLVMTLRRLPLFNDLSPEELALLAARVTCHEFAAGTIIFSEGDLCRELFIVKEGMVKVLKTSPSGRQQLLALERAGNSLSEVAVFDGGAYPATAKAATFTVLLRLEAEHFRKICMQRSELAMKVIKVLGHRLRRMSSLVESLSFSTVRGRLVAYLAQRAEEESNGMEGEVEFVLMENNEELAAHLGTVRELVSRNLGRLHGEGLIQMRRRTVTIPNLAALKAEIEDAG